MKPISTKLRRYVERQAPQFVAAVYATKENRRAFLPTVLDEFEDDMTLLYACLWFSYSEGVAVLFEAPSLPPAEH